MRVACDAVVFRVVVDDADRVGFVELGAWQYFLEKTQGHVQRQFGAVFLQRLSLGQL